MAKLQFSWRPGPGDQRRYEMHYCEAVRVGDILHLSGTGGADPETGKYPTSLLQETDFTFRTISEVVQNAIGTSAPGSGWKHVFKVTSYHVNLKGHEQEIFDIMIPMFKKWCGEDHAPIWTLIGVEALADEDQRVEIEVSASLSLGKVQEAE